MAKAATNPDPLEARKEDLRAVGVSIEPMKANRGRWKVVRTGDTRPMDGTYPIGYDSQEAATAAGERVTAKLRDYRLDADMAWSDYQTAIGYTHANPQTWMDKYNAAHEYERTEAVRLGLPTRPNKARGHGWRK